MKLENSFLVPRLPSETWEVLLDVELIVGCVPGAELTSDEGDRKYKGKFSVGLGPVTLSFKGTAELTDLDKIKMTALLKAKGMDEKGRGSANSVSRFTVEPVNGGSRVSVETDLNLSGAVAQYGRASGIINAVANEIVGDFADNLHARLKPREARTGVLEAVAPADAGPAKVERDTSKLGPGLLLRALASWLRQALGGRFRP